MCIHRWARQIDERQHVRYVCARCMADVDFTAAREEYDRAADMGGEILTPGGIGRFVEYDPAREMVTVEMDFSHLVQYPAGECYPVLREEGAGER